MFNILYSVQKIEIISGIKMASLAVNEKLTNIHTDRNSNWTILQLVCRSIWISKLLFQEESLKMAAAPSVAAVELLEWILNEYLHSRTLCTR